MEHRIQVSLNFSVFEYCLEGWKICERVGIHKGQDLTIHHPELFSQQSSAVSFATYWAKKYKESLISENITTPILPVIDFMSLITNYAALRAAENALLIAIEQNVNFSISTYTIALKMVREALLIEITNSAYHIINSEALYASAYARAKDEDLREQLLYGPETIDGIYGWHARSSNVDNPIPPNSPSGATLHTHLKDEI